MPARRRLIIFSPISGVSAMVVALALSRSIPPAQSVGLWHLVQYLSSSAPLSTPPPWATAACVKSVAPASIRMPAGKRCFNRRSLTA